MSIWPQFGFRESPYATKPIPPTEEGDQLLVGRNREIRRLTSQLTSSSLHPTVEGDNGVGKTSLIAVACYRLRESFHSGASTQAFLPLSETFQLTQEDTLDRFARRVFFEVARTFVSEHDVLKAAGFPVPTVREIDRWLSSPLFSSGGGGISVLGAGVNVSRGRTPNTSAGFNEAGFTNTITRWLRLCFPTREAGGFICVIDNLELLKTARAARTLLESMRDTILDQPGLLWILSGARGIIRTAASSPRLEGRLADPIELTPVPELDVADVVKKRVEFYRAFDDAVPPVDPEAFQYAYTILNRNLRNALKLADDFSLWLFQEYDVGSPDQNRRLFETWIRASATKHATQTKLRPRTWEVFDRLAQLGGACSMNDFPLFGFRRSEALRPHLQALEDVNLLQVVIDDEDSRRKTMVVTPRGWLIKHYRQLSLGGVALTGEHTGNEPIPTEPYLWHLGKPIYELFVEHIGDNRHHLAAEVAFAAASRSEGKVRNRWKLLALRELEQIASSNEEAYLSTYPRIGDVEIPPILHDGVVKRRL
jgi:hypothetical protein